MAVLIVSSRQFQDAQILARAASQEGWHVHDLDGSEPLPPTGDEEVAFYMTTDAALKAAAELGIALIEPPADWLTRIPQVYLRREVRSATVAEARKLTVPAFVKPADPTAKKFDSGVYPGGWAIPVNRGFSDETPVLISEPVEWEAEYRCFWLEGVTVARRAYARVGRWKRIDEPAWPIQPIEDREVSEFCVSLGRDPAVHLPPATVIDVGWMEGRGWAIVELNPVWSAGLYGCDPNAVLPVLQRACIHRSMLSERDRRWVFR